ncbi:hypothetical protein CMV30_13050 [Nibricoccus aquaticus]|uniref:Oxygen sensor histidine kinase NreB n=1 Tax=Nibricoccus aquaticus TaxID=2576891 RepID=A0A290Q844_9BACT|nr:sensor histidine kinase [Nibricoccus aquaticus]ATC64819.1 hypothetical protein CMV30_13050 [Nibricoccus aquaticus]
MQPTIQQSQIVHHRVSVSPAPLRNQRNPPTLASFNSGHGMIKASPIPVDLARTLLALLPGRAALLDASGLVIAWNDPPSLNSDYDASARPSDIGLIVTPLNDTGGITLVWAPEADATAGTGKRPSRALTASRAQICDLTSRLMHAQEVERKKIARELHDDLGQRLAAHALAIGNLKQHLTNNPTSLKERLLALENDAVELGESIRMVSHELHPVLLERLGLSGALRAFASEFCDWSGLRLVPDIQNSPAPLPGLVAIATYRIAQEAIRNIERHAHATSVHIKLRFTAHHLHLVIEDDGIGFTADTRSTPKGLGLTSIEERVRLLNGRLRIDGPRGRGTTLTVRIPTLLTAP